MGHSLGGASLLIYAVMCRRARRPHRLYRLILLTPAGFLQSAPKVTQPEASETCVKLLSWLLQQPVNKISRS